MTPSLHHCNFQHFQMVLNMCVKYEFNFIVCIPPKNSKRKKDGGAIKQKYPASMMEQRTSPLRHIHSSKPVYWDSVPAYACMCSAPHRMAQNALIMLQ